MPLQDRQSEIARVLGAVIEGQNGEGLFGWFTRL